MLSDIELYYSNKDSFTEDSCSLSNDEFKHAVKVMRHNSGDSIFISNGIGLIAECRIEEITSNEMKCTIVKKHHFQNNFENITIAIPRLKAADRMEFALEKCVELGFTNFIVFESDRTIAKGSKLDRWKKVTLSAMKQSLNAFLPKISFSENINDILSNNYQIILSEQQSTGNFKNIRIDKKTPILFIAGPEGGFSDREKDLFMNEKAVSVRLTNSRLRSETAVLTGAVLLHDYFNSDK